MRYVEFYVVLQSSVGINNVMAAEKTERWTVLWMKSLTWKLNSPNLDANR